MTTEFCQKCGAVPKEKASNAIVAPGRAGILLIWIVICCAGLSSSAWADDSVQEPVLRNDLIENGPFIHIPGPNPILTNGPEDAWDGAAIEVSEIFKDENTYYLYYHGISENKKDWPYRYRIGVATASCPLGPWKKYEGNPILDLGPEEAWDNRWVACAAILKEKGDKYYMFYSGNFKHGLAYASGPLGPWKKYEGNPILAKKGGSYLGNVFKVDNKYYMYEQNPVNNWKKPLAYSPDQGPFCLNIADKPEGPWTSYEGNPVIPAGDWGAWDDGGFSEAGVLYHDGLFHCFYSGTKWKKLESIGYAYSFDGFNWIKYSGNPIIPRENCPNISAFAEVHSLWEPPFIYLYNTQRYITTFLSVEHLGVQVLTTQRPFSLRMPVLNLDSLDAAKTTALDDCPPIGLSSITRLALTAQCTYSKKAKKPIRIHIVSSDDGLSYDTTDLFTLDNAFERGQTSRKTFDLNTNVRFIKVMVENLDKSQIASDVQIVATLGG